MVRLRGITWNHSRGFTSVVATAQRYMELHPEVEITWEKRSLQAFADYPVQELAAKFDLLVIDHPWAGYAAGDNILVPLEKHLSKEYMDDQLANTVGASHLSYNFDGYQTALAIDAATPVASYRPDLFEQSGEKVPDTWEELLALAKKGKVAFAGIPIDTLMNFYMLCSTQGEDPCVQEDQVISREMGVQALEQLRELTNYCTKEMFDWNPIKVYEAMTSRDDIAYCPFAYGYSNYSRDGYSRMPLQFGDMVSIGSHGRLRSTLGGTGLAVSTKCENIDVAVDYAAFTASPIIQRTLFTESGGQPGHRGAWLDEEMNRRTRNYFKATLPALDRSYLRPRYYGYLHLQDNGGDYVRDYVRNGGDPIKVLEKLDELYRESKQERKA